MTCQYQMFVKVLLAKTYIFFIIGFERCYTIQGGRF
jgi:hypothetical protein